MGHFGANFWKEGLANVSQILTRSGKDAGLSMQKKSYRNLLSFEHNARTRQTEDHATVTSIRYR